MKKTLAIVLIVLLAVGTIFAVDSSKLSMQVSAGTASMVERTFDKGDVSKKASTLGIGADLRCDYEVVKDMALTGVIGWMMPDRTFLVGEGTALADVTEGNQNYLKIFGGLSFIHVTVDPATNDDNDIVWTISLGPELWINLNKGKVGGGGTMILKGAYCMSDNISLDLVAKASALGIADAPMDTKTHLFTDLSVKAGCTYKF